MKIAHHFALSFALAACLAACLGNASAADLMQSYRDALAYDASYASAKAALEAGQEKLPQGRAGLLPTVSLAAGSVWNHQDMSTRSQPPGNYLLRYNNNFYSVQLSQPLFRWQNWVQYKEAQLSVAIANTQFIGAEQDLVLRVAQAYFDVLLAQDALETARAQKTAISEQLAQARRNFEVGTATVVDSHEAQARFDLASAQEIAAGSDLEVKRQALRQVTGKVPDALKGLRPDVQIALPQPADMDKWAQSAEQGNLGVQAQELGLEIASREVERNHANHLPSVDLVASYGRNSLSAASNPLMPVGSDTSASTVGVQLSMPLFTGGAMVSRDREAVAQKEKARQDLENARRNAALAARQAYLGATSGLAQVKALEAGLTSSMSALDSNKLGYEVGVRINIDVLNAQQQVFATRRDLARARYDTLMAELKLKAAAGTLNGTDLQKVNALLQ
ncbi:MAG: TolC family outer membrane protein [Rhodocyclaceae bacterium]|nr:TolC family outer membrane protein [Rhodocyclaceae bacterium]